jgi:hypothetical protein
MAIRLLSSESISGSLTVSGAGTIGGALSAGTTTITSDTGLRIYSSTNTVGANITFSDIGGRTQTGSISYFHADVMSYGSGNAFVITGDQATMTILADGKLMYKEGVYLKPATGTGAGTRKDNLWDAAYNDKITSLAVSGTTTKTLTATQQDGGTLTASWTDNDSGGTVTGTGANTEVAFWTGTSVIDGSSDLRWDNTNKELGIGRNPDYSLDIYKSSGTSGSATGTTMQRLWNYVGGDLSQQKTFIDFVFQDDNDNEYPQVRIGAEVGQNGDANSQEKEGSGAFVVYTNNATGVGPGTPTGLSERLRVDYAGNVDIPTDTIDGGNIIMQNSHFINKRFAFDSVVSNAPTAYMILCEYAPNQDVNGIITMDRTSGLRHACSIQVLVSSGSGTAPVAGLKAMGVAGAGTPFYQLVTCDYDDGTGSSSHIAVQMSNPDGYYETSGAYFTGRIVNSNNGVIVPVLPAAVSNVVVFEVNCLHNFQGDAVFNQGNVGIGVNAPGQKLEVAGNAIIGTGTLGTQTDALLTLNAPNAFAGLDINSQRASGNIGGLRWRNSADTQVAAYLATTTGVHNWYAGQAASINMTLSAAGNLGVGRTAPDYKLVISNSNAEGIEFGPGYVSGINLWQNYNRTTGVYVKETHYASEYVFLTAGSNLGKVGIGTNTPNSQLTIETPSVASGGTLGASVFGFTGTSETTPTSGVVTPTNQIQFKPAMPAGYGTDGYNTVLEQQSGGARVFYFRTSGASHLSIDVEHDGIFGGNLAVTGSAQFYGTGTSGFGGNLTVNNMLTINIDDISTGENRGLRIINTNGVDQQWNITAGVTGEENDSFCIRNATDNINALKINRAGDTLIHDDIFVGSNGFFGDFTDAATRKVRVQTAAEYDSLIELRESTDNYGFTMGYYGSPNTFQIKRHDNSAAGVTVLTIPRTSGSVTFASTITTVGATINGTLSANGTIACNNTQITGVNHIEINDPGPTEGINWNGGNLWRIVECPDNMTTNGAGNLQFSRNGVRSVTVTTGGALSATGDVIAYSDRRVKENIKTIDNALEKVTKLRGVSYNRTDSEDKSDKIGVIAQEVIDVVPEVVTYGESDDRYSVSYGNMAGIFIEAIKELKAEVEELKKQIK